MSNKENILSLIKARKEPLFKKYRLKYLAIFGSFSRDDFKETSDVDILVDFETPVGVEFIDLADELEQLLNRKVDLVSRNGIKAKYYKEIEKELIYV